MSDVPPTQPPDDAPPPQAAAAPKTPSGPQYDIAVIGRAWPMIQAQLSNWVIVMLVFDVIVFGLSFGITLGSSMIFRQFDSLGGVFLANGINMGLRSLSSVAIYIMAAGLYNCAFKQIRGEAFGINDLFAFGKNLPSILIAAIVIGAMHSVTICCCYFPTIIVGGACMFVVPLIVDKGMGAMDALRTSFETAKPQFMMAVVCYLVFSIVAGLGIIACGLGTLVTVPIAVMSVAMLYRNFFPS